jgi:hypothetical protein
MPENSKTDMQKESVNTNPTAMPNHFLEIFSLNWRRLPREMLSSLEARQIVSFATAPPLLYGSVILNT